MARLAARNALALACLAATHGGQVVTGEPAVGLRVWVNDEAIAMVESAVRPILGGLLCVAPVPPITQTVAGLEIYISNLVMRDCSALGFKLASVEQTEEEDAALAVEVVGLAAHFSAEYCWATGYGWAKFWSCGPVSGEILNGTNAQLRVHLNLQPPPPAEPTYASSYSYAPPPGTYAYDPPGAELSLAGGDAARVGVGPDGRLPTGAMRIGASQVSVQPDIGRVALQVGFGLGGAFDSQGGISGIFSAILGPVVGVVLEQVLTNVTAALAAVPPALILPDPTAAGNPASSADSPFTPAAAPIAPHSTYVDTSLLALERLPPIGITPPANITPHANITTPAGIELPAGIEPPAGTAPPAGIKPPSDITSRSGESPPPRAAGGGDRAYPGVYVADLLFTVNDTRACAAAFADETGGDGPGGPGGDETWADETGADEAGADGAGGDGTGGLASAHAAATAAAAAASYRAGSALWPAPDEGIGERPPPEHEGYMVTLAMSSLPVNSFFATARRLGLFSLQVTTANLLPPALWQGRPYGVTATIFPSVSFEPHAWPDGAPPIAGSRYATGGRYAALLAATLSPAARPPRPDETEPDGAETEAETAARAAAAAARAASLPVLALPFHAAAYASGGIVALSSGLKIDAAWAGEASARAELSTCGVSGVKAHILGDGFISVHVTSPLAGVAHTSRPSDVAAVRCHLEVLARLAGDAPMGGKQLAALDDLAKLTRTFLSEAVPGISRCLATALAPSTSSAAPSSFLHCAAAAAGPPLDIILPAASSAAAAAALGAPHGLYRNTVAAAARLTKQAGRALGAAAEAGCAAQVVAEFPGAASTELSHSRALAARLHPLLLCYLAAAAPAVDALGDETGILSAGSPLAALAVAVLTKPSAELECFVGRGAASRGFAQALDCALASTGGLLGTLIPALRNLAGAGWSSWASAITLPGLMDQIVPLEAQAELDLAVAALASAFRCAQHSAGLAPPAVSPSPRALPTSSASLRCAIDSLEPLLTRWAPPIAETLLSLPSHPGFTPAVLSLVADVAAASPAAAAVLGCLAASLGGEDTAGGGLACAADAAAPAIDARLDTAQGALDLLLPPGALRMLQQMAQNSRTPPKNSPASPENSPRRRRLAQGPAPAPALFLDAEGAAGAALHPAAKKVLPQPPLPPQPTTAQGLIAVLNAALSRRQPRPLQAVIDSLESAPPPSSLSGFARFAAVHFWMAIASLDVTLDGVSLLPDETRAAADGTRAAADETRAAVDETRAAPDETGADGTGADETEWPLSGLLGRVAAALARGETVGVSALGVDWAAELQLSPRGAGARVKPPDTLSFSPLWAPVHALLRHGPTGISASIDWHNDARERLLTHLPTLRSTLLGLPFSIPRAFFSGSPGGPHLSADLSLDSDFVLGFLAYIFQPKPPPPAPPPAPPAPPAPPTPPPPPAPPAPPPPAPPPPTPPPPAPPPPSPYPQPPPYYSYEDEQISYGTEEASALRTGISPRATLPSSHAPLAAAAAALFVAAVAFAFLRRRRAAAAPAMV